MPELKPIPLTESVRLAEIIGALSFALDLAEGQPRGHSIRCCWIGMQVGRALGLGNSALADLYYALLLKDVGCTSNASRLAELSAGDDIAAKRHVKTVDIQSRAHLARFLLRDTGLRRGLRVKFGPLLRLMLEGDKLVTELVRLRSERGAEIARRIGFGEGVSESIRCLDEHWNGKGRPQGFGGDEIPMGSRIALLAQVADVFRIDGGRETAIREVGRRSGRWFDPRVVEAFSDVAASADVWTALEAADLDSRVRELEVEPQVLHLTDERIDAIAGAFADVIDSKSPFTNGHSTRVGDHAAAVAQQLGFPTGRARWIRRAGLLHDIGKLGVSNTILDKPGLLDMSEWDQMRRHPEHTLEILSRIAPFRQMAVLSADHHERLDGEGYPRGLDASSITLETRIITTADIFDALTEARPHRGPMPLAEALSIMDGLRGTALDPDVLDAMFACAGHRSREVVA